MIPARDKMIGRRWVCDGDEEKGVLTWGESEDRERKRRTKGDKNGTEVYFWLMDGEKKKGVLSKSELNEIRKSESPLA